MRPVDHRVEQMIRNWILLEETHQHDYASGEEESIAEVVLLPTGYEIRGFKKAS